MILGIGVDIIEPERIARALDNPRFLERVYTPGERARIASAGKSAAERAAGIFAAKEAAVKALGCGFAGVKPCEVEILAMASGQPTLEFSGGARDKAAALGVARLNISISHIKGAAVAFVVLEGE